MVVVFSYLDWRRWLHRIAPCHGTSWRKFGGVYKSCPLHSAVSGREWNLADIYRGELKLYREAWTWNQALRDQIWELLKEWLRRNGWWSIHLPEITGMVYCWIRSCLACIFCMQMNTGSFIETSVCATFCVFYRRVRMASLTVSSTNFPTWGWPGWASQNLMTSE